MKKIIMLLAGIVVGVSSKVIFDKVQDKRIVEEFDELTNTVELDDLAQQFIEYSEEAKVLAAELRARNAAKKVN